MIVELPESLRKQALDIARRRGQAGTDQGRRNFYLDQMTVDYRGARAELAVADYLGVPARDVAGSDDGTDMVYAGKTVDVKWAGRADWNLMISSKAEARADYYVLVVPHWGGETDELDPGPFKLTTKVKLAGAVDRSTLLNDLRPARGGSLIFPASSLETVEEFFG